MTTGRINQVSVVFRAASTPPLTEGQPPPSHTSRTASGFLHTACDSMTHQIRGEMSRSALIGLVWVSPSDPEAPMCLSCILRAPNTKSSRARPYPVFRTRSLRRKVTWALPHALLALPRVYNTATLIEFQCRLDLLRSQSPATSPRLVLLSSRCLPRSRSTQPPTIGALAVSIAHYSLPALSCHQLSSTFFSLPPYR